MPHPLPNSREICLGFTLQSPDANAWPKMTKLLWMIANLLHDCIDLLLQLSPQTGTFCLIPVHRVVVLSSCDAPENDDSAHFQPNRWRTSARTCSQGTPSPGLLKNSSARRSNSAS